MKAYVMNTEIIAFFSAAGVFRKRSPEKQREAFDLESDAFESEFNRPLSDTDWQLLLNYQRERYEAKLKRETDKIARDAAKAAKLEAMPLAAGLDSAHDHIATLEPGKYILTCAQNNTHIDKTFWASLQAYATRHDATILVAKTLYNKRAFRQPGIDEIEDYWFDKAIVPFLVEGHIDLGGMHFIANANVIPTAKWPTSGFEGITPNGINAIIPATKIELRVGAALKGASTKVIASTGAVTKRNYILRKTGAIASFSHNIGALFVDTESNTIRHLEQMPNCDFFCDLDGTYSPRGFEPSVDIAALQLGDIHAEKMSQDNMNDIINLMEALRPSNIVLHDVLDFSSRNHHNIKDPVFIFNQTVNGHTVQSDLESVADVLTGISDYANTVHVVESNHDLALNTWLKNADFKTDPTNALFYLQCMTALYEHIGYHQNTNFNMLKFAYKHVGGIATNILFHETDKSVVIAGIEMGNHGHNGANGSRGNPKGFAGLGVKMNTGHTHSPSIYGGCYTAGVSASLEMGYNVGPSSWALAHIVTYENGQRQILFM